jgi:hypothetical protein
MRTATAWSRRLGVLAALAVASVLAEACESKSRTSDEETTDATGCLLDSSSAAASATPTNAGDKQQGTICPRGDRDWYALDVPAGSNLLDVSASYSGSLTKVKLFARLYGSDGVTPVADGEIDDATPATGTTSIATTLRVAQPGRYYLEVGDIQDKNADSRNSYVLTVGFAADPDPHEPNDTASDAKVPDTNPGYLAYRGDVDVFRATTTEALLRMTLDNPAGAKSAIDYQVTSSDGTVIARGSALPAAAAQDTVRAVGAAGDYLVTLRYPPASEPDRRPEAGYRMTLASVKEPDPHESPVRNDSATTATCPGGGAGPCNTTFSGAKVDLPVQHGFIASVGDRDVYRIDATGGVPAVLEADLSAGPTPLQLALTILTPHAESPCTSDTECAAINVECKKDSDCELSHKCLTEDAYTFCKTPPCRLCEGSGACVPSGPAGGPRVCAAIQYTTMDADGGMSVDASAKNSVRTAQPIFTAGPVYVVVHDFQDQRYDLSSAYDLALRVAPEPDPNDQSGTASERNNFYNPYLVQDSNLTPNKARAKDITAEIGGANAVTGYLSYQADEDWYVFDHPCPGQDCGLVFEWVQPGPSPVRPAFILRTEGLGIHESWTYSGATATTSLAGPVTATFGEGDCHECSFASQKYSGKYYLQVRDVGAAHWDFSGGGKYSFRLKTKSAGCPAQCSEFAGQCGCYCKDLNQCPPGLSF